jgi:hypothetical protein
MPTNPLTQWRASLAGERLPLVDHSFNAKIGRLSRLSATRADRRKSLAFWRRAMFD